MRNGRGTTALFPIVVNDGGAAIIIAQFFAGYGTPASEMLSAGRYRVMYRVS